MTRSLPIAVIGAGPAGLAAAAHLASRGQTPLVLEAGPSAGAAIREWGHVRMFSPWRYNIDQACGALLDAAGWSRPAETDLPTGRELVERYLEPLSRLPALAPHIQYGARVLSVGRKGFDKVRSAGREETPFELVVGLADGTERRIEARAVIDASGTWSEPNPIGSGGVGAEGERAAADAIRYGIPDVLGADRDRYAGRTVMVVGSGHSAMNGLLDLGRLQAGAPATRILWALRKPSPDAAYGGGDADMLSERGALGSRLRDLVTRGRIEVIASFRIGSLERGAGGITVSGWRDGAGFGVLVDEIIAATGFRPNLEMTRELRLGLDPWLEAPLALAPMIDPNLHSCGTVRPHGARELAHPEKDFYIVGMKSYGRAPTFLAATGYEQVRSVVAALVGDEEAAARVELCLPETGVCSSRPPKPVEQAAASCCGTATVEPALTAAR